jgi:hypothetical protein
MVVAAGAVFAWVNVHNAANFAPQWGQDLAFFHQWVHSAATGGPWASPLILEPQGFWTQVHTHLIMPFVVGVYTIWPCQNTLLVLHSLFACLAIWPIFRLGESAAGGRHGLLMVLAVLAFGPFQGIAVADFRPVALFLPGIIGIWASAWVGDKRGIIVWALVAIAGRQEAVYLLMASGTSLMFCSWGKARRSDAALVLGIGLAGFMAFVFLKPEMFFHINPSAGFEWPTGAELWDNRLSFGIGIALSGWLLGLLAPAPLIAMLPVLWGMLTTGREWHSLSGPGAHHHVFWLPFVIAAGTVGSARVPRNIGPLILIFCGAMAFPWAHKQAGNVDGQSLVDQVPSSARVAADYSSIARLSGRPILWNVDQLHMPDQPWHWKDKWPITEDDVDIVLAPKDHPVHQRLGSWHRVDSDGTYLLLRRP